MALFVVARAMDRNEANGPRLAEFIPVFLVALPAIGAFAFGAHWWHNTAEYKNLLREADLAQRAAQQQIAFLQREVDLAAKESEQRKVAERLEAQQAALSERMAEDTRRRATDENAGQERGDPAVEPQDTPEPFRAPSLPVDESAAATQQPLSDRDRVIAMLQKYAPQRVSKVDSILGDQRGHEHLVLRYLVGNYGPEPDTAEAVQLVAEARRRQCATALGAPEKASARLETEVDGKREVTLMATNVVSSAIPAARSKPAVVPTAAAASTLGIADAAGEVGAIWHCVKSNKPTQGGHLMGKTEAGKVRFESANSAHVSTAAPAADTPQIVSSPSSKAPTDMVGAVIPAKVMQLAAEAAASAQSQRALGVAQRDEDSDEDEEKEDGDESSDEEQRMDARRTPQRKAAAQQEAELAARDAAAATRRRVVALEGIQASARQEVEVEWKRGIQQMATMAELCSAALATAAKATAAARAAQLEADAQRVADLAARIAAQRRAEEQARSYAPPVYYYQCAPQMDWNTFQAAHRGQGYTSGSGKNSLSRAYARYKR
jgi:hypothetical protein